MPLFRLEVFKSGYGETWENVYTVQAADLVDASQAAGPIQTRERGLYPPSVILDRVRISTLAQGDNQYMIMPSNLAGNSAATDPLPLFCTARVDIQVDGGGRPSRKFYRAAVFESQVSVDAITTAAQSNTNTIVNGMISDVQATGAQLTDEDGQIWQLATVYPRVQMRQLHRRRRRPVTSQL